MIPGNCSSHWLKVAPDIVNSSVLVTYLVLLLGLSGLLGPVHPSGKKKKKLKMLAVGRELTYGGMVSVKGV